MKKQNESTNNYCATSNKTNEQQHAAQLAGCLQPKTDLLSKHATHRKRLHMLQFATIFVWRTRYILSSC